MNFKYSRPQCLIQENLLFKIEVPRCPVLRLSDCLSGPTLDRTAAGESIDRGIRRVRRPHCMCGIALPVTRAGGVRVGKRKGYNHVRAANVMSTQFELVIIKYRKCYKVLQHHWTG